MNAKALAEPNWIRKPKKVWSFAKDWEELQGEYIAFAGPSSDIIITHGKDTCEVLAEARQYVERPILMLIPPGGLASFLWLSSQAK
jgi:hypothetical protein